MEDKTKEKPLSGKQGAKKIVPHIFTVNNAPDQEILPDRVQRLGDVLARLVAHLSFNIRRG